MRPRVLGVVREGQERITGEENRMNLVTRSVVCT